MAGSCGTWTNDPGAGNRLGQRVKWEGSGETLKACKLALLRVPGEKAARSERREGAREPERARELWAG